MRSINIEKPENLPELVRPGDDVYITTKVGERRRITVASSDGKTIKDKDSGREFEVAKIAEIEVKEFDGNKTLTGIATTIVAISAIIVAGVVLVALTL